MLDILARAALLGCPISPGKVTHAAKDVVLNLLSATERLHARSPEQPSLLYETGKALERLDRLGVSIGDSS